MKPTVRLRKPNGDDGPAIFDLIKNCPPLDTNSLYCNLLQATHFADTCVAAELDGELAGFVSGYILPSKPDILFIWQVAVSEVARGQKLAQRMISEILSRPVCTGVSGINTTITKTNQASWNLFQRIATTLDAELKSQPHFLQDIHFNGQHDTEYLVNIGPFSAAG